MPGLRELFANDKLVRIPVTGSVDVSGTVVVSGITDPVDVSGSSVDVASLPAITGAVTATPATITASPTVARVATSTASATLLSANSSRKGAIIYNDSLVVLYIKFGTTASATDFTIALAAAGSYQLPDNVPSTRIDGILASSTGNAQVTEW